MSDLRTLLHDTATPSTDTSDAVAEAHLAHARGVLRSRNSRRVSVGSRFVAAAALIAFVIDGHNTAPASPEAGPSNKTTTITEAPGVRLVSYTGTQPTGVPDGVPLDHIQVGGHSAVIAHMLGSGDTHRGHDGRRLTPAQPLPRLFPDRPPAIGL